MFQLGRSAGLTGYAELARTLGLDAHALATAAGVPVAALIDPDLKISSAAVGWMLETAAEKSGAQDFGLRLAEGRRLANMGAVGLIAREQPSLRKALEVMAQYLWMQNDALSLHVEEAGEVALLRLGVSAPGRRTARQATELSVGVFYRNLRALLGEGWRPHAVFFTHAAPRQIDAHRRVFGSAPSFEQDFNGLVCGRADLDAPITAADPDIARQMRRYLEQLAAGRGMSARRQADELIAALLPRGDCTAKRVAGHLGIDRRTLHRHLAREGTTFIALVNEARKDLAASLVTDSKRSLQAIAELLGFSSLSAFSHWFRRRFACTATAYRNRGRDGRVSPTGA